MSKYSNFPRNKHDAYQTPEEAAQPLRPFLAGIRTFAEPCCGEKKLVRWIESMGPLCVYTNDIQGTDGKDGIDALTDPVLPRMIFDAIITNPPYTWEILEPMIRRFMTIAPTWLLLEADKKHTLELAPLMPHCSDVVSIGRVRWFIGTTEDPKVNYAWYRFHVQHTRGPAFHPPIPVDKRSYRKKAMDELAARAANEPAA